MSNTQRITGRVKITLTFTTTVKAYADVDMDIEDRDDVALLEDKGIDAFHEAYNDEPLSFLLRTVPSDIVAESVDGVWRVLSMEEVA